MKIYEINAALEEALSNLTVDEETGEIVGMEQIQALQMAKEEKLLSIGKYIKSLDAEVNALYKELNALDTRIMQKEKQQDRLVYFIESEAEKGKKLEDPQCVLSWRKSVKTKIENEAVLPREYIRIKSSEAPDLSAISKAIKEGKDVPGAILEQRWNLQIK